MKTGLIQTALIVIPVAIVAGAASDARADASRVEFPFHDDEYLRPDQSMGGASFVPGEIEDGASAPLVVFLHGVNREGMLHPWLGGRGTPDLTSLAAKLAQGKTSRPFILAGPSETLRANAGGTMWRDFDLGEFVDAVDASLEARAHVARDSVIVAGHSGAGCNPDGGLLRAATSPGSVTPAFILAIDTCLDTDTGRAFGATPAEIPVYVQWERIAWPRRLGAFFDAYDAGGRGGGRDGLSIRELTGFGVRPHEEIVARTLTDLLPRLLPMAGEAP